MGSHVRQNVGTPHSGERAYVKTATAIDDRLVRDLIEQDRDLASGVINPGGSSSLLDRDPILSGESPTPGLGSRFKQPVVNLPGPDLVLFELQGKVEPAGGDLKFSPERPLLAQTLTEQSNARKSSILQYCALPLGIDLSDLGYRSGAAVDGLFLQDDSSNSKGSQGCNFHDNRCKAAWEALIRIMPDSHVNFSVMNNVLDSSPTDIKLVEIPADVKNEGNVTDGQATMSTKPP